MRVPCLDCEEREVGCHSKCPKYKDFLIQNKKRKEDDREFYSRFGDTMTRLGRTMYGGRKY